MKTMKMNKKNVQRAIVHTFFDLYTVRQLAERVVNDLDEDQGVGSAELHSAKADGFTIRCKKDTEVENSTVRKIIASAMADMLDDKSDEATDVMFENHDMALDLDTVDTDLIHGFFDINQNGRLIVIEIDM